jgi:protocatechuate 3,4-dioxygenase beta subunit
MVGGGGGEERAMKRTVLALGILTLTSGVVLAQGSPQRVAPPGAPASGEVAPSSEPGQRLEVGGTVFAADGKTPIAGASVYVYQTDARGYYRPDDKMGNRNPRLFALLRTDANGHYSYRTIRPGSYPDTRVVQHIHYEVAADGHGSRIFEIVFEDDPMMTEEVRRNAAQPGSIYSLRRIEPGSPAGRVVQDVVLPAR